MLLIACVSLLLSAGVPVAKPASTPTLKPVGDGTVPVFAVGEVLRTSVDNANVRGDPSTDKKPVATLPFGTQVRVVEAAKTLSSIGKLTQRWYRVETIDQAKPATGWLFGNTLTTLGSTTWSVTFTAEGPAVVRFFRATGTPTIVSADVDDVADSTLQAIPGPLVLAHPSVVVRGCDPDCFDVLVVERGDGAVIMGAGKPPPNTPLSAATVVVGREDITFHGKAAWLGPLLRPQASYTDDELVERFLRNCNDVVRVVVRGMFDDEDVVPQCEERPFEEQNCSPDGCESEKGSCLVGCGMACNGCDTACGGTCSTCMNRCTDDVCRRQCAKARVACFNGCVNGAGTCRSGGCADAYEACWRKIEKECGGHEACSLASQCVNSNGTDCPKQSAWCNNACFRQ